jgi:hypothetical protein
MAAGSVIQGVQPVFGYAVSLTEVYGAGFNFLLH